MARKGCSHLDVREFDGLRTCLACGETRFRNEASHDKAATEEQEYIYTDLRCLERGQTIRIVVLAPGNYNDAIHCTLVLSGIQHSDYDAVSYTWATEEGDDSKSQTVYIDGSILRVTQNCHSALRQLRHPDSHRRLWVDAMCINQQNVHERNHQVGIMDHIYREASQVLVCISDPVHSYSNAMARLSGLVRSLHTTATVEKEELRRLLMRRYFGRVWVIQEVLLARSITLHVNSDKVRLTDGALASLASTITAPGPLQLRWRSKVRAGLEEYLRLSLQSQCSDPRDHVYAILSLLSPDIRDYIPVDYSLSIEQVYENVVTACIAITRTLNIFAYAATVVKNQSLSATRAFTVAQFHNFLASGRPSVWYKVRRRYPLKWKPEILLTSAPRNSQQCQVQILPAPKEERRILPKVRVRAHCISVCQFTSTQTIRGLLVQASDVEFSRNAEPWVACDGVQDVPLSSAMPLGHAQPQHIADVLKSLKERQQYGSHIFATTHGMGRSVLPALSGDCVYHLNGMHEQLLLRPVEGSRYDVVSICWWEPFPGRLMIFGNQVAAELIDVC